jgi:cobalt-precorrin 5A hydrolase/precorrin-3B C17-methyltransferase
MASLVYELVDESGEAALKRLHIHVVPGISALQAAAARAGAPLGHDFCTVSLSDLLTPWEVIEKRLRAAAEGDFVVALYNPVSRRRRDQLMKAKAILLARRPAETPVVVARNLGRDEERVTIIPLGELESDQVDMLTLLIIGNTETRTIQRDAGPAVYTPRGYGAKAEKPR